MVNTKDITITAITFSYFENGYHTPLVDAFNKYSEEKGLGITLKLKILTAENSTTDVEDYGSTLDSLLLKKSTKYDLYFFYSAYSQKFGKHFANLRDYIPEEYIDPFDDIILSNTALSTDKRLVGLPVTLDIGVVYANVNILGDYNKEIPKTWEELLETSKYILTEEKKKGNTDFLAYNGLINESSAEVSTYEFINSFRESNDSPPVDVTSQTAIDALEMLKRLKNEIASDSQFKSSDYFAVEKLMSGSALFLKFWYIWHPPCFKAIPIPGRKEGVTGTYIIANNIGINTYIEEEKKIAAAEFIKFIALRETQKNIIIKKFFMTGILELYNDEEVCQIIECSIFKKIQPFLFMNNDVNLFGSDSYHEKYKKYILNYLYNNKTSSETLKLINDITRMYKFSLKTEDSSVGFIIFIIFLVFSALMILSLIFLHIKKFEKRFHFLPKYLWYISTLGSLILMCSLLSLYEDVTNAKCHLRAVLINIGFTLSICPFLIKLIINFPEKNKYSIWISNNKYMSVIFIMMFTIILNGISAVSSYDLQNLVTSDGENYNKCLMRNTFGKISFFSMQIYNVLLVLISLILIFVEWNLKQTRIDVKLISAALFMDILSLILLNVINKIEFNDYIIYNTLLACAILVFSISNHIFTYTIRILPTFGKIDKFEDSRQFLGKVANDSRKRVVLSNSISSQPNESRKNLGPSNVSSTNDGNRMMNNTSTVNVDTSSSIQTGNSRNSKLNGISQKLLSYHNKTDFI